MSDPDLAVVLAMRRYGGGFAHQLAEAALHADSDNLERIKTAWPDLWDKYRKLGDVARETKVEG